MSDSVVLHGVDFSGGESHAGKIWLATRRAGEAVTLERGFDHRSIVERIAASAADGERHLWRIDAPFGVALEMLDAHGVERDWLAMARWLESFGSPREWRRACRAVDRREPRRTCDRAARTPMAPSNLRVFKQTWTVIVRVLAPLTARGVRIEPCAGERGRTVVCEGCPATVLHVHGWPARGYKGRGEPPRALRAALVERVRELGVTVPDAVAKAAIEDVEGDGLDALLLVTDPLQWVAPAEASVEGWVW